MPRTPLHRTAQTGGRPGPARRYLVVADLKRPSPSQRRTLAVLGGWSRSAVDQLVEAHRPIVLGGWRTADAAADAATHFESATNLPFAVREPPNPTHLLAEPLLGLLALIGLQAMSAYGLIRQQSALRLALPAFAIAYAVSSLVSDRIQRRTQRSYRHVESSWDLARHATPSDHPAWPAIAALRSDLPRLDLAARQADDLLRAMEQLETRLPTDPERAITLASRVDAAHTTLASNQPAPTRRRLAEALTLTLVRAAHEHRRPKPRASLYDPFALHRPQGHGA